MFWIIKRIQSVIAGRSSFNGDFQGISSCVVKYQQRYHNIKYHQKIDFVKDNRSWFYIFNCNSVVALKKSIPYLNKELFLDLNKPFNAFYYGRNIVVFKQETVEMQKTQVYKVSFDVTFLTTIQGYWGPILTQIPKWYVS